MAERAHKILLLNPPSARPVFRDGYCSGVMKGSFFIHPMDLQMQSGFFDGPGYRPEFIDAVFERLSPGEALGRIRDFAPDSILSLVGEATLDEDASFLAAVKSALPETRIFLTGDIARFSVLRTRGAFPSAEGLLMDFSSGSLKDHLEGRPARDVLTADADPESWSPEKERLQYPLPHAGFTTQYSYQLPFFREPAYYSVLNSFGCPFNCFYCNTHCLGYRARESGDFLAELAQAARLGFKSLYVRDATFLLDRGKTLRLFDDWEKAGFSFQWICFSRPDLLDEEVTSRAARLGCTLIMLGVESYDERCLAELDRPVETGKVERAFRLARQHGIRTSAQIIVGMRRPEGDGREELRDLGAYEAKLKKFLRTLDPDFISLNVFHRRPGIESMNETLAHLEAHQQDHQSMASRLSRNYYLRPRTFIRNVARLRNFKQFRLYLKIARQLIAG